MSPEEPGIPATVDIKTASTGSGGGSPGLFGSRWFQIGCLAIIIALVALLIAVLLNPGGTPPASPSPTQSAVVATPTAPPASNAPSASAPATQRLVTPTRRPPQTSTPTAVATGASNPGQTISAPVRVP